jgi:hypothetical protein
LADPLEQKGLDELLRFINGGKDKDAAQKALEAKQTSKAAKRARQKQRKVCLLSYF